MKKLSVNLVLLQLIATMIEFYKKQIFLPLWLIFLFCCGVEKKVNEKIDEIDDAYITISGNLSHNDSSVTVGIIFLLEGRVNLDLDKLSLELDNLELVNGSISLFNGNYTIFDVSPGEYYVVAIEDNNANLEYDPNVDRVGLYGFNLYKFDPIPNVVTVNNEDVEDININYFFLLDSPLRAFLEK